MYILNGITYNYTIPDGSYSATDLKTLFNSNISLVVSYNNNEGFRTKINDHVIDSLTIILEDDNAEDV